MGLSLNEIRQLTFESILDLVEQGLITEPNIIRIYFDNAKKDEFYSFSGNFIYVVNTSNADLKFTIKFNRIDASPIPFEKAFGLRRPYKRFWINADAYSGGYADILVGTLSPDLLDVVDNRIALIQQQVLEEIRDTFKSINATDNEETTIGTTAIKVLDANSNRKCFSIFANPDNTGLIYVLYKSTISTTKYKVILQAGDFYSDDKWKGEVYCLGSVDNQLACIQEES